jgi:hypothetical protein
MGKLLYAGFINEPHAETKRLISLAAETKGRYLVGCLGRIKGAVTVLVPAPSADPNQATREESFQEENATFVYSPCGKRTNKILRYIDNLRRRRWLYRRIVRETDRSSIVIVYHSGSLIAPVLKAKRKRGFKLIIEAEELYGLMPNPPLSTKKELAFFDRADGFIPITPKLNETINRNRKPFAVFYGAYDLPVLSGVKSKSTKNVVFAGTFENGLNRGHLALEISNYLPVGYALNLLSSSNPERAKSLIDLFEKKNPKHCPILFQGTKIGDDFNRFLQSCDVAISPQDDKTPFSLYSFPSKVVVYLANGLPVVATKLDVIKQSPFSSYVEMVEQNDPKIMAKAIVEIAEESNPKDGRAAIKSEAAHFEGELIKLLDEVLK